MTDLPATMAAGELAERSTLQSCSVWEAQRRGECVLLYEGRKVLGFSSVGGRIELAFGVGELATVGAGELIHVEEVT